MKLESEDKSNLPSSVLKNFELQGLLANPESDKLYNIDKELQSIWNDTKLPLDERIRKFERLLAKYRKTQYELVENGGTSLFHDSTQALGEKLNDIKDVIANMVKEVLQESSSRPAMVDVPVSKSPTKEPPKAISSSSSSHDTSDVAFQSAESTPVNKGGDFESSLFQPKSLAFKDSPKSPHQMLGNILKTSGVSFINDRVYFPGGSKNFSTTTYSKAFHYLLGPENAKVPARSKGIFEAIYNAIKDDEGFEVLKSRHPNMAKVDASPMSRKTEKWMSIP